MGLLSFFDSTFGGKARDVSDSHGLPVQLTGSNVHLTQEIKAGGTNLFNYETVTLNVILTASGGTSASSGWLTSAFIPVSSSTAMVINKPRFIAEYNVNQVFVAGTYLSITPTAETTFTTSATTAYVRVTISTTHLDVTQLEYGTTSTTIGPYYEKLFLNGLKYYDIITPYEADPVPSDYTKYVDRSKYQIWKRDTTGIAIKAVYGDIAVKVKTANLIYISTTGINGGYDITSSFTVANFPNLMTGSYVENVFIMPWTRNLTTNQTASRWRMVITTTKGQVYHNFPSRAVGSDGAEVAGDIIKFEESVIWDLTERKFPSTDPAATGTEIYFPCLPTNVYENHPILNTDAGFVDTYGNGGFGKSKTVGATTYPRFYVPKRMTGQNFLFPMGGYEPGDKLTLIGTYQSNQSAGAGCRIAVFATDDGGRQWYCKYEFGDQGSSSNWVNNIDTSALTNAYTADSFQCILRENVYPSSIDKEPATLFTLGAPVVISSITRATTAVATTSAVHGLTTGDVIAIQDNPGSANLSSDWDWMRNDTISTTSGGTGVLFKVEVVNTTSFKLHDYIHSAFNNLPARHIHHINKIKDGWIIGTGESYPEGWILYAQMKKSDNYAVVLATDTLPIYRLTSTSTSVQRLLGGILLDDTDNTFIAAIDNEYTTRSNLSLPTGRTDIISRSSTGIYSGKLSDIDDMTKFTPIYEAKQVAYFFKEIAGVWMFIGQRGEFAISFDKGVTWNVEDLGDTVVHYYGESRNTVVIDDFVFVLK
jgi:hypothetical protein